MRALLIAVLLLAIAGGGWWLSRRSPTPVAPTVHRLTPPAGVPPLPAALADAAVLVSWSADTHARFEPCGCVAGMYGGLVRRAALLARADPARLLAFELGGWSAGSADHERLRTDAYLAGLARAGIAAAGIGRREVALGAETLAGHRAAARGAGLAIVSANVRRSDGSPLGEPLVHVHAGGRAFAVTAVAPADAVGSGLSVRDPADAVASLTAAAGGEPLVVLADLDEAALAEFARAAPGVALVIGGAVTSPSPQPLAVGAVRIVHVANHGKVVGWWAWGAAACQFDLIADTLPDQPELAQAAAEHQRRLGTVPLAADAELPLPTGAPGYAGAAACTACHAQAATVHAVSRHASAFAALVRKEHQHDPDCLRCHVTGLERPSGFRRGSPGPGLDAVSCEACHGPASLHVAAAQRGDTAAARLLPVSAAACATCHDPENSPRFRYEEYWPRIAHGR